jgi:hypothetical protein
MIADQAAINAVFDFLRYAMKPMLAVICILQS